MAELFGGGEVGLDIAAFILEVQNGLPVGKLGRRNGMEEFKPSPVKPNPT